MEQEQTNQNQAPPAGEEANKSSSSQALVAFGSRECEQFFGEGDKNITKKRVSLTDFFTSLSRQIYSVACGAMHTLILTTNGEVYSFGNNDDGALGRTGKEKEPLKVDLEVPVDMISAGDSHSVACNSAHSLVYHWGAYRNTSKGNISKSETPHRIGEDEFKKKKVKRILSGAHHTLALVDGKIYAWGDAEVGILGRMSTSRRKLDQGLKIEGMGVKGVVEEIYTGAYHAFLKKTEKKKNESYTAIYAWGLNNCGQLGIGNTENQHNPVEVTVLRDKNIESITGGEHHTIVLTEDGEVYSFGKNDDGQCGLGEDFEEKEESEAEEEVEEEQKKTPAKPAKPPAKSTSKKGKGKGKKGGSQKKGQDAEEEKTEEKEDTAEKKDGEQEKEGDKEGEKEKEAEKEKEGEKAAESQEAEPEKKDEEKGAEEAKEAAAEPEKEKAPKTKSNKKKEKEPEPENSEEQKKIVFKSVKKPQKVEIANVDKIFSGSQFNYAITKEQEIYSWGMGTYYVLGNKNEESVYKPTKIEGELIEGKRIVALGLGSGHVIAFGVDKDAKDPELEEEAFAKVEEQGKISRKGTTTGKKGEKKGKGKKGEEEESGEKDVKKNLTASLEEEHEEKEEKNKRGQKKSLKRKASDEGEENGIKKVKKSPSKELEAAAESKMEEEKPNAEGKKIEEEVPKASEEEPVAAKEDTGKMEEEKPAEAKTEEKTTESAQAEEKKAENGGEKAEQPQAEGENKEENKAQEETA